MKKINKKFIYGTGSVMLVAGVCIVIVLLNIIASILTDNFGIKIDVTETRYLSFSSEFNEFIKSVDKDVSVYYLVNPDEVTRISGKNQLTGAVGQIDDSNYRERIRLIFEKIEKMNSKIHFEIIDPEKNPDKVKDFGDVQIDDIVFVCGNMNNSFNVQEILGIDEYGRQTIDAESKFSSMINSVMRESKVKVGIVTGHGEGNTAEIKRIFDDEAIEYEDFNILLNGISDEYDLIFIYGPTVDFSVDEIDKIESFLASGKDMQVYLDRVSECTNLVNYMSNIGIQYIDGYIMETNPENIASGGGKSYILPMWNPISHPITNNMINNIYVPETVGLMPLWDSKNSINVVSLVLTSPYAIPYTNQQAMSSYDIITISQRITSSSILSDVMACGSPYIYNSEILNTNKALLVNSVLWMGREDESSSFSTNVITNAPLPITEEQHNIIQLIFVVLIPFIIIIIGLVVWLKRRYL